jgi:hypothetical protein
MSRRGHRTIVTLIYHWTVRSPKRRRSRRRWGVALPALVVVIVASASVGDGKSALRPALTSSHRLLLAELRWLGLTEQRRSGVRHVVEAYADELARGCPAAARGAPAGRSRATAVTALAESVLLRLFELERGNDEALAPDVAAAGAPAPDGSVRRRIDRFERGTREVLATEREVGPLRVCLELRRWSRGRFTQLPVPVSRFVMRVARLPQAPSISYLVPPTHQSQTEQRLRDRVVREASNLSATTRATIQAGGRILIREVGLLGEMNGTARGVGGNS